MVSSRYGVDTKGFDFSRLPSEYAEMDTQAFKGELGTKAAKSPAVCVEPVLTEQRHSGSMEKDPALDR